MGLYTYAEFGACMAMFLPVMGAAHLLHRGDPGKRVPGQWMRRFGRVTTALSPIWKFSVEGNKPPDIDTESYVVVSNHQSNADPFLLSELPWDMRWISKEELFKLPLLGWMMKAGGDIALKRGDRASVEKMFEACRQTLQAGVSVMIFPEGTRSKDGKLQAFKDGAFQLAIETQRPMLPMAVYGTRSCLPKGSRWLGDATAVVKVLEPVPTKGLTMADLPKLKEDVRNRIAVAVEELETRTASSN